LRYLASKIWQRSRQHKRQPSQLRATHTLLRRKRESSFSQALNKIEISLVVEELANRLRNLVAHVVDASKFFLTRADQSVHAAELVCQCLRRPLAHMTNAK